MLLNRQFKCKGIKKHLFIKFKTKWLNLSDNFYPEKKKDTCLILHNHVHDAIKPLILLHEKFLQFDWLRAVIFQLNLKYLHVKITNLLRVVV